MRHHSSTYVYASAKLDLSGRGFLGFRQTSTTDLQTGIVQTSNYGLTFPYIGLLTLTTNSLQKNRGQTTGVLRRGETRELGTGRRRRSQARKRRVFGFATR